MIRFIADLHFDDAEVMRYDKRPFETVEEMNSAIIKAWNSTVMPEDTVYVLGDVADNRNGNRIKEIIRQLKGRKILVIGNHDKSRTDEFWRECGFAEVYRAKAIILEDWLVIGHEPPAYMSREVPWVWLYGHVHDSEMYQTITGYSACVCASRWDYKPVSKQYLLGHMQYHRART